MRKRLAQQHKQNQRIHETCEAQRKAIANQREALRQQQGARIVREARDERMSEERLWANSRFQISG